MRHLFMFAMLFAGPGVHATDLAQQAEQHGDITVRVSLDPVEQSGNATGSVRIHARRELVWSLITSCPESVRMVPGLEACEVISTAPDGSQRIRHVMNYSWYIPRLHYDIHATYDPPARVSIERISGDLRTLRGSWVLTSDGEDTVANYAVELAPGFWVPHWIVRAALQRDLPQMLRALRARAETLQSRRP